MNLIEYKQNLTGLIDKGEFALPDNVKPEAFKNAAIVAFTDNPKIASCTPDSVFRSLRRLAARGLVPDGREAALVPFKAKEDGKWVEKCQDMPMIYGLIKMVRNSAEVSDVRAHIVYADEVASGRFRYVVGDAETLEHEPILFGDKGDPVAVYAIANMKDGSIIRSFMDADEVDKVRRSAASQRIYEKGKPTRVSDDPIGIWKDWAEEMWRKTAIRRLTKRMPMSAEDHRRIVDSEGEEFAHMKDVSPERPLSLEDRIAAQREMDQTPEVEPEDVSQVDDAEVVGLTATPENAFPGSDEFTAGAQAFADGQAYDDNPWTAGDDATQQKADDWAGGFNGAQEAAA